MCELASAWRRVRDRHASLHLLVVGVFEDEDPLPDDVVASLRSDPRIRFTGIDWDTPRLYAAMDVVALPSYREGLPNLLLEAAAMALPVVATSIPGCADAVQDGFTGALVPPCDADALANALDATSRIPRCARRTATRAGAACSRSFARKRSGKRSRRSIASCSRPRGPAPHPSEAPLARESTGADPYSPQLQGSEPRS